jgi:hypothetical protein
MPSESSASFVDFCFHPDQRHKFDEQRIRRSDFNYAADFATYGSSSADPDDTVTSVGIEIM